MLISRHILICVNLVMRVNQKVSYTSFRKQTLIQNLKKNIEQKSTHLFFDIVTKFF